MSYQIDKIGVLMSGQDENCDIRLQGDFFVVSFKRESSAFVVVVVIRVPITGEMVQINTRCVLACVFVCFRLSQCELHSFE